MPSTVSRRLTPAALFAAVLTALAQPVATARPDPLDPTAIAPPMAYESSLRQYRRFTDEKPSTRELLVRLLGAWGAQLQFVLPERLPDLPDDSGRHEH